MILNSWLQDQITGMLDNKGTMTSKAQGLAEQKAQNWENWRRYGAKPSATPATSNTSDNFYGQYTDLIGGELTKTIKAGGMSDFLQQMLMSGKKDIARKAGSARSAVQENLASAGFKGAGANLYNDILNSEIIGTEQLTGQIGGMAEQAKSQALGQLLGLTQFQGSQDLAKANREEQIRQYEKTFQENVRQFGLNYALKQRELDLAEENQGGGFWDTLGGIAGGIVGIATGGISSGLGSFLGEELFG